MKLQLTHPATIIDTLMAISLHPAGVIEQSPDAVIDERSSTIPLQPADVIEPSPYAVIDERYAIILPTININHNPTAEISTSTKTTVTPRPAVAVDSHLTDTTRIGPATEVAPLPAVIRDK